MGRTGTRGGTAAGSLPAITPGRRAAGGAATLPAAAAAVP
jgi:hypothetical protein